MKFTVYTKFVSSVHLCTVSDGGILVLFPERLPGPSAPGGGSHTGNYTQKQTSGAGGNP